MAVLKSMIRHLKIQRLTTSIHASLSFRQGMAVNVLPPAVLKIDSPTDAMVMVSGQSIENPGLTNTKFLIPFFANFLIVFLVEGFNHGSSPNLAWNAVVYTSDFKPSFSAINSEVSRHCFL